MPWVLRKKGGEAISIDREISIGRDPSCTIRIQAPAVSRIHCRLQPAKDHVILLDEGRNGTLVNGIRVGKVAHVRVGDVIEVDNEHFQIQRVVPIAQQQETQDLAYIPEDDVTTKKDEPRAPDHARVAASPPPRTSKMPDLANLGTATPPPHAIPQAPRISQAPPNRSSQLPPTIYPPPPPPVVMGAPPPAGPPADLSAPTTEVSAARVRPEQGEIPFEVEVVEDPAVSAIRYRDAVRLMDEQALLVMTDFAGNETIAPELVSQWKAAVRKAGSKGKGPDEVLRILNKELTEANLQATATCARLNVRERLIAIACAGTAPPFVLRAGNRVARVQATPTVALGRVRAAQFQERTMHFDRGDTLLLPSAAFFPPLDALLSQPFQLNPNMRVAEWIRHHRIHPPGGSLLCLSLR